MTNFLSAQPFQIEAPAVGETKFCTTCGYQNPNQVDACLNCSAALGTTCPMCTQVAPATSKFCVQCGAKLTHGQAMAAADRRQEEVRQNLRALMPTALAQKISAASGEIFGEQREVTVIFVSVSNFAASANTLDEEDIYFLTDEALRLLVEVVYKYEGIVDKFTGSGLVALFGAPVSHENDPERAVRAALEMQTTIQKIKHDRGLDLQLRLGLNTGMVIAGKVGNDLHMDYTVIGETVNLASHLESAAKPGAILVSGETYQRTEPLFEFETATALTVEALPEPMQAFRVVSLSQKSKWSRKSAALQTHMIGRANDLVRLQNALAGVRQRGQSRIALVTGEAGLGKSRLVAEFARLAAQLEARVYLGSCLTYARSTPLWVVAALLRDILRLPETAPRKIQHETLQAYLDRLGLASDELLPYLGHVLGLEQTDPEVKARLQHLDATMLQRQTHAALRQIFLAEAKRGPTVLILEDLHWVDPASKDFLEYLIHTTAETALLLVLVSRETEREAVVRPILATAANEPERLVDIQLQALSETDGHTLIEQLVQQSTAEAWSVKEHIVKRAEGNPFYIEEIIRMLIDQGGLVREDEDMAWQVTSKANELLKTVPGTVRGLILARFDRLPESLRRTLQKAAILGTSFPVSLLQALNDTRSEVLAVQLRELEARQFLESKSFRSEPGCAFRLSLLQETIYSTLIRRDRRKIHTKVAEAIEGSPLWLPEERVEVLAYHFAESTHPAKAVPYLLTAAENGARRCAYETVIEHYRRAITLLPERPGDSGDEYFRVRIGLGRALKYAGQFATAGQVLTEALENLWHWSGAVEPAALRFILVENLRQLADVRQREGIYDRALAYLETGLQALGEDGAPQEPGLWRSLLDRMAWIWFRQGQLDEAFALASKATAGLDPAQTSDPIRLASLYNTLGGISWHQGNLDEAIGYVERSLDLYESLGYLWGTAIAYGNLGILYYVLGNWSRATEYYERAFAVQQIIGSPEAQAVSFDNLGLLHMAMGQHDAARRELEAGLSIRQRLGETWGTAQSHVNLAHLALVQFRFEEAAKHAEAAMSLSDAINSAEIQVPANWCLAMIQAERGELEAGLQTAEHALELAQTAQFMEGETDCRRVLGILHARAGQPAQAETHLQDSLELCRKQNARYRQGLALLELGRVLQDRIRADQPLNNNRWQAKALAVLGEASGLFRSLGAAYDLRMAQVTLEQIESAGVA